MYESCRGQSSIEFVLLFGFAMLVFLSFFVVIEQNSLTVQTADTQQRLREVQNVIVSEFDFAAGAAPGYARTFTLPPDIDGLNYSVELDDGQEIVVLFGNDELVSYLDWNATGNISKGKNRIQMTHSGIVVSPIP